MWNGDLIAISLVQIWPKCEQFLQSCEWSKFCLEIALVQVTDPLQNMVIVGHFQCHWWCHIITHVPMSGEGGRCNAGGHLGACRRAESAISWHFSIKFEFVTSLMTSWRHWWCHFMLNDWSMMWHPCHFKNGGKRLTWGVPGWFSWIAAKKCKNVRALKDTNAVD